MVILNKMLNDTVEASISFVEYDLSSDNNAKSFKIVEIELYLERMTKKSH